MPPMRGYKERKEYEKRLRKNQKDIREIANEASRLGMSYGQYVASLAQTSLKSTANKKK